MEGLKKWAVNQHLGEEVMLENQYKKYINFKQVPKKKRFKLLLSEVTKTEKRAKMVEDVVQELGKGAFELFDAGEKRFLRLFIWAGCGCHKDLNTVRGGYVAMEKWWKEHDIEGPIILANQDNDAVLEERDYAIAHGDEVTPAQE